MTVTAFCADGVAFGQATFTVTTLGVTFASGLSGDSLRCRLDFAGHTVRCAGREEAQQTPPIVGRGSE
jgi:hypothetical protein